MWTQENSSKRWVGATMMAMTFLNVSPIWAHGVWSCNIVFKSSCPNFVEISSAKRGIVSAFLIADGQPGDSSNNVTPQNGSTADVASPTPPESRAAQPLKGQAVLNQATELKQLGIAARKLAKAAEDLYGEATTQQVQMMYEPDVIGTGQVIMIPRAQFTGMYLPPRKKWVDQYVNEMADLVPLIAEEFDDVVKTFPQDVVEESKEDFDQLNTLMDDVRARLDRLQQLQKSANYANKPLADEAYGINDDMKKSIKEGRDLFRTLKKFSRKREK